jgi:hypothetical protein
VKVRYCDGGSFTGDGADAVCALLSYAPKLFFIQFYRKKKYKAACRYRMCERQDINLSTESEVLSFLVFRPLFPRSAHLAGSNGRSDGAWNAFC